MQPASERTFPSLAQAAEPASATPAWIARALREAITYGELKVGTPLRQDHIAAEFGVSHIPVREALRELVAEGLAVFVKNHGVVVAELSADFAWELTEYRCLLEGQMARWAVPSMTEHDFAQAKDVLARLDAEIRSAEIIRLNVVFHEVIYRRAGRPFFLKSIEAVRANLARYWRLAWEELDHKPQSQREHRKILKLCQRGDAGAVGDEIERHIRATGSLIVAYIRASRQTAPTDHASPPRSRPSFGPRPRATTKAG